MGDLMLKPLLEVLHFTGVEPDWMLPTIDEVVSWREWPVKGEKIWMGVSPREVPGYERAAAHLQYTVEPRETVKQPFEMTVAILINCQRETRDRLRVEVFCFMEYAVEMYHQLVEQLRKVHGGEEPRPAEKLEEGPQPEATKKKRRGGSYALTPDQQRELVEEYRRLKASGKVKDQDTFAALNGISSRTLRNYLRDNPETES